MKYFTRWSLIGCCFKVSLKNEDGTKRGDGVLGSQVKDYGSLVVVATGSRIEKALFSYLAKDTFVMLSSLVRQTNYHQWALKNGVQLSKHLNWFDSYFYLACDPHVTVFPYQMFY